MKKLSKLLGIIALVAIIGFSMAACDEGGGGGGPASGMETLSLSGRVSLVNYDFSSGTPSITYSNFIGNLEINDYGTGGSGAITNGNLSYSVGTPSNLSTFNKEDVENYFEDYDITLSTASVQATILSEFGIANDNDAYLYRGSAVWNVSGNSGTQIHETVDYIYVNNDITITGTGGTEGPHTNTYEGITYTQTYIARNFSLALKTGWNAIYSKNEISSTLTGPAQNPTGMTYTSTITISLSNPSLRWVLEDYVPPPTIPPANHTPLTFDTWANGNITSSVREQYFSFTATATQHYIHFNPGTLDDVDVEVYNTSGNRVGYRENLYGSWGDYASWSNLTSGQTYYIRVMPWYSGDSGNYQIAFNSSYTAPPNASLSVIPSRSVNAPDTVLEKPKKDGAETSGLQTLLQRRSNRLPLNK